MAMKEQTVVVTILLLLLNVAFTQGTKTCRIDGEAMVTTFGGEMYYLYETCKYRLADITCGDYRLKVSPGNEATSGTRPQPNTVRVLVDNQATDQRAELRISLKRLSRGWKDITASSSFLDSVGYDSARGVAAVSKSGVFDVEFSDQGVSVSCHSDTFESLPAPQSLCGAGTSNSELWELAQAEGMSVGQFVSYEILTNSKLTQSKTCSGYTDNCDDHALAKAITDCADILATTLVALCIADEGSDAQAAYKLCLSNSCSLPDDAVVSYNDYIPTACRDVLEPPGTTAIPSPTPSPTTAIPSPTPPPTTAIPSPTPPPYYNYPGYYYNNYHYPATTVSFGPPPTFNPDDPCYTDPDWYLKSCSSDSDCGAKHAYCPPTTGTCICQPGYYYYQSGTDCCHKS